MNYEQIPAELRALPQWVVHKAKCPYDPRTGYRASAGQPETWATFNEAVNAAGYDGIGFEFMLENGLVGIDLDTVRDPETGWTDPLALELINQLDSYTEISPSGYGFHIIARGTPELARNKVKLPANQIKRVDVDLKMGEVKQDKDGNTRYKHPEIEMYTQKRYFTMTGNVCGGYGTIHEAERAATEIYRRFFPQNNPTQQPPVGALSWDAEIGGSSQASSEAGKDYLAIGLEKDSKFRELWDGHRPHGNESADDQALMNKLAYWCNCNTAAMINAFKQSPHCQQKDPQHMEKAVVREDYLPRTVEQAVKGCTRTAECDDLNYQDRQRASAAQDFAGIGQAEGAPKKIDYSRLIAKSAAEVDFSQTPPTIFYIDGIIAQGLTFLNAFSKVGKSRVILQMLLAICRGLSFFGKATKKCSVLYLALEDERRDLESRLKAFLQGEPPPENFYWMTKEDFDYEPPAIDNGLFELLETQLKEHPEIKVVAIDVFGVIRSKRLQNEDFSMHERRDLNALLKFTAFNDLAMINAHHVSKAGMAQNRISSTGSGAGSYVLSGTVHTEIEIALDSDDPKRAKFSVKGRRMPAISFAIRDEYPFWKLEGDWAAIKIAEDPIITTVKWLVSQNGTWKGSAKDLLDANKANSFLPPILKSINKKTLMKLAREFQSAGIHYVQHTHGSAGVIHEFFSTEKSNDVVEIDDGETWEDIKLKA